MDSDLSPGVQAYLRAARHVALAFLRQKLVLVDDQIAENESALAKLLIEREALQAFSESEDGPR